jgi:hypothetical protein
VVKTAGNSFPLLVFARPRWHLAQLNIGRIRAPTTGPLMVGFVAKLEPINALADISPLFFGAGYDFNSGC